MNQKCFWKKKIYIYVLIFSAVKFIFTMQSIKKYLVMCMTVMSVSMIFSATSAPDNI